METFMTFLPIIACAVVWFGVARFYKTKGKGAVIRHLVGFVTGFLAMIITVINFIPPKNQSPEQLEANTTKVQTKSEAAEIAVPSSLVLASVKNVPQSIGFMKPVEERNVPERGIMPLVTQPPNIDHSNVPIEKVPPKKATRETTDTVLSPQTTKPNKQTKTVTYLKDDGASPTSQCGSKRLCKQMSSCAEARFYLNQCGLDRLDRDGDGVPCESLCLGKKRR